MQLNKKHETSKALSQLIIPRSRTTLLALPSLTCHRQHLLRPSFSARQLELPTDRVGNAAADALCTRATAERTQYQHHVASGLSSHPICRRLVCASYGECDDDGLRFVLVLLCLWFVRIERCARVDHGCRSVTESDGRADKFVRTEDDVRRGQLRVRQVRQRDNPTRRGQRRARQVQRSALEAGAWELLLLSLS